MNWIHLYDEELGLKGILYFRNKASQEANLDGTVKLYSNQVFVADNVKEIIPDFLLLQNGVIDCNNLPLNVSRSALQTDGIVATISNYLTKQVALKLYGMFTYERYAYESFWEDLNPFVKYCCIQSRVFSSIVRERVIFQTLCGHFRTLGEYLESVRSDHEDVVYYVSDEIQQAHYIRLLKKAGINALMLTHVVDQPFMRKLEIANPRLKFRRIDSDVIRLLTDSAASQQALDEKTEQLQTLFDAVLQETRITVKAESFKSSEIPSLMVLDETTRRMKEMIELYNLSGKVEMPETHHAEETLALNVNNEIVQFMLSNPENETSELFCRNLHDLACLSQEKLQAENMAAFIERSNLALKQLAIKLAGEYKTEQEDK